MLRILYQMVSPPAQYVPQNGIQFFAIQLARKLEDLAHLPDYISVVEHYPRQILLQVYRRVVKKGPSGRFERFREELSQLQDMI